MKLTFYYIVLLFALALNACKKEDLKPESIQTNVIPEDTLPGGIQNSPWESITCGITTDCYTFTINDTLRTGWGSTQYMRSYDLNLDGLDDISLLSVSSVWMGQMNNFQTYMIKLAENCDILIDLGPKVKENVIDYNCPDTNFSEYTYTEHFWKTPKALNYRDVIDKNGSWYHKDTSIIFMKSEYIAACCFSDVYPPCQEFKGTYWLSDWSNQQNKYVGLRIRTDSDTLYAWLKLNFKEISNSYVHVEQFGIH